MSSLTLFCSVFLDHSFYYNTIFKIKSNFFYQGFDIDNEEEEKEEEELDGNETNNHDRNIFDCLLDL